MVRVLQNKNLIVVYSKNFLFFEWKLEESDLKIGSSLRSSEFDLGGEKKSFLEFIVSNSGSTYLFLNNSKPVGEGRCVLTTTDKNEKLVYSTIHSLGKFVFDRIDLLGMLHKKLTFETAYPIVISCTIRSSITSILSDVNATQENSMKELSSDLKNILKQCLHTDVELITDGESIRVHKIILQARSPVFRRMFEHDSSESSKNTVVISDIGSATVKRLVNFLYTGMMDSCEFDEALELYYAGDKYEVLSLLDDCTPVLLKHLDVDNACRLFTLANRHNDDVLKEKVVQFVSANYLPVVSSESMQEMSKEDVIMLTRLCAAKGIKQENWFIMGISPK